MSRSNESALPVPWPHNWLHASASCRLRAGCQLFQFGEHHPCLHLKGSKEQAASCGRPLTYPLPIGWLREEAVDPVEKIQCSVGPVNP